MDCKAAFEKYRFYHCIEVAPGVVTPGIEGYMRPQRVALEAMERIDFTGQRVLDVGCRDGLFGLEAERRGASEVIGIDSDLSRAAVEFIIPHLGSNLKMFEMNLYDLTPESFGLFDVVIFPGVLYHLRYPIWGLHRVVSVLRDGGTILIETGILDGLDEHALMYCPIGAESPYERSSVTFFNVKGLIDTLSSIGVTVDDIRFLRPRADQRIRPPGRIDHLRAALGLPMRRPGKAGRAGKLPTNRATVLGRVTRELVDPEMARYWDSKHSFHTTGEF